jgi:VWFA-related protein
MIRCLLLTVCAGLLLAGFVRVQKRPEILPSIDLVTLDISVVDGKGKPVTGLSLDDFIIKEDGHRVDIETFEEVTPTRGTPEDSARSIVALLDDVGVPLQGSRAVQSVGQVLLNNIPLRDDLAVVRLHNRDDEPFGDRRLAEARIAEYRAGAEPFMDFVTAEQALDRLALIAGQLESIDGRRKILVCVGSPAVCNIPEPSRTAPRQLYPKWVSAIDAAARANIAIYSIVPARIAIRGGGLPQFTGGEVFASNYDIGPAIDRILQDGNQYYMAGYWPPAGKSRELHSISVQMARKGLKVRVRRQRGA